MNLLNNGNNMKICDISRATKKVNAVVKIVAFGRKINTVSKSNGKKHSLSEVLVGDQTGCIYMNLWDQPNNILNVNDYVEIKNGYISLYRGDLRLNIGRRTKFKRIIRTPFDSVNLGNNKSSSKIKSYPPLNIRSKFGLIGLGRLYMDKPIQNK